MYILQTCAHTPDLCTHADLCTHLKPMYALQTCAHTPDLRTHSRPVLMSQTCAHTNLCTHRFTYKHRLVHTLQTYAKTFQTCEHTFQIHSHISVHIPTHTHAETCAYTQTCANTDPSHTKTYKHTQTCAYTQRPVRTPRPMCAPDPVYTFILYTPQTLGTHPGLCYPSFYLWRLRPSMKRLKSKSVICNLQACPLGRATVPEVGTTDVYIVKCSNGTRKIKSKRAFLCSWCPVAGWEKDIPPSRLPDVPGAAEVFSAALQNPRIMLLGGDLPDLCRVPDVPPPAPLVCCSSTCIEPQLYIWHKSINPVGLKRKTHQKPSMSIISG